MASGCMKGARTLRLLAKAGAATCPGPQKGPKRGGGLLALTIGCKSLIQGWLGGGHVAVKVRFCALLRALCAFGAGVGWLGCGWWLG